MSNSPSLITRLTSFIRNRWHPLWRLRRLAAFRRFQHRYDVTIYKKMPETGLRVAVKLLRDASWIASPTSLEPEVRRAFKLVLDILKPAVFWDVGANIGFYSWVVRRHPSIREVIMFEPDPTNFDLLLRTIRRNKILDCRAMKLALSDCDGEASFLVDHASGATGSLESHREEEHSLHYAYAMNESIVCRTSTVDTLISEGVPLPELMKIDVEGAERLVLAGADVCLSRHHPTMIIETSKSDLVKRICKYGYTSFQIDDGNLLFIATEPAYDLAPFKRAFPQV